MPSEPVLREGVWWIRMDNGTWLRWDQAAGQWVDPNAGNPGQVSSGTAVAKEVPQQTDVTKVAAPYTPPVASAGRTPAPKSTDRDQPDQPTSRGYGRLFVILGGCLVGLFSIICVTAIAVYAIAFRGNDGGAGSAGTGTAGGGNAPSGGGIPGAGPAQVTLSPMTCEHTGTGKVFDVGPGQSLDSLGKVPWETLSAGDTVRIHWRAEPYREKFFLRGRGTKDQPIVVCGVTGPNGEAPVIDGQNAVTRAGLPTPNSGAGEPRGLIHITLGAADPWGYKPQYIVIQGLHIRNAFHDHMFTAANGRSVRYADNAAGIIVERGEHIVIRGVVLEGNGNGFFVASGDSEAVLSRDILIERSRVFGNGTVRVGADRHHNIYTEALGMVIQFNDIGPLRESSQGGAVKDRSAGTVVRYNRIEGGSRTLDLVDAEDSAALTKDLPEYRTTLVYGNLLINGPVGASNMVHYGGDSGITDGYRKGTLYFYNNTLVVRANQEGPNARFRTTLFDADTSAETIDARNNIIVVRPATPGSKPTDLTWMRSDGILRLDVNWAPSGITQWRADQPPANGRVTGLDKVIGDAGNNPGFTDENGGNFALAAGAAAAGKAVGLHDVVRSLRATVDFEYVHRASGRPRPTDSTADLGAFSATGRAASPGAPGPTGSPSTPGPSAAPSTPRPSGSPSTSAPRPGNAGPTSSGLSKPDGWSGPLQYLGKGPNGVDNGQRSACTGARAGSPSVICVRAGASGGSGTAAAPFGTIGAALAAAVPRDVIQVAAGTYPENVRIGTQVGAQIQTEITLLGGFSPDFSSRNASQFRSVIRGSGAGPTVQWHLQSNGKSVLDGFRITGGRGLGTNFENGNGRGGGVYVELIGNGEVLISHNDIFGNQTSGFEDDNRGGGIHAEGQYYDGSKPVIRIEDNVIHGNQAGRAAGINVAGRTAVILRNVVEANRTHSDHGGGIYISTEIGAEITDNVVRGNEVGVTVKYGWGGGIIMAAAPAELRGNVVTGNFAPTNGAGVFWDEGAKGTMREDLIFGNGCPSAGDGSGMGLYVDGGAGPSIVTIEHVTIADHRCTVAAPAGAAVLVEGSSRLTVRDSIIWGNTRDFQTADGGSFVAENSVTTAQGRGNRNTDPQFVDAANGDYHLRPGSSAIGAATDRSNLGAYPK